MTGTFKIGLDFKDNALRKIALAFLMNASYIKRMCIIEKDAIPPGSKLDIPFDILIFDDKYSSQANVKQYCSGILRDNKETMFIHLSKAPVRDNSMHLIGLEKGKFIDNFTHLIGFCFLTHLIKCSCDDPRISVFNFRNKTRYKK